MPPRSLRRGDRCPNPGAVRKGCSRPKVLRFDAPLGGLSVFGTGEYIGNILQGGVALKPQDYLLDGVTPLPQCIVVTGAATVAQDALTGAAAFMCRNLVCIGAGATLTATTNCKGLLGFVSGRTAVRNGARLHMDKLGKAGNFGDLTPAGLAGASLRVNRAALSRFIVSGEGGPGGEDTPTVSGNNTASANPGCAAGPMQTGGGASGAAAPQNAGSCKGARGGKGGPCCGGAAGSSGFTNVNGFPAGMYGGPGGNSIGAVNGYISAGGAGEPAGADAGSAGTVLYHATAGGGLLMLFSAAFDNGSGCVVSADGSAGTSLNAANGFAGSGAGGGCVVIVTRHGGYANNGTVRASGGAGGVNSAGYPPNLTLGPGGAGSVNILEIAA